MFAVSCNIDERVIKIQQSRYMSLSLRSTDDLKLAGSRDLLVDFVLQAVMSQKFVYSLT